MIADYHRQKGGAPLLGANAPGEIGPFGTYGDSSGAEEPEAATAGAPAQEAEQIARSRVG
ncbi:hypothetical protein ACRWOO_02880 [Streptomyces sp. NEAU-PBA10]|uniref:hypothetical protein n=1 Tax=Streptomyces TaxID=1883 RepID=UPI0031E5A26F